MSAELVRDALFTALLAACILPPREAKTDETASDADTDADTDTDTDTDGIILAEKDIQIDPGNPDESQISFSVATAGVWLEIAITSDEPEYWYGNIGDEDELCWRTVPPLGNETSAQSGYVYARDAISYQYVLRLDGDEDPTAHVAINQLDASALGFDPGEGYHCETDAPCSTGSLSCTSDER